MYPARSPRPPARRLRPRRCRRPILLPQLLAAAPALLILFAAAADATLHPVDYLALQSICLALNDLPGSSFFASWDFIADPCGFAGVSCSSDRTRVAALALGDPRAGAPGLSGAFPSAAVSKLSALASLSLDPGRITGSLSSAVAALLSLHFLALSGNFLSGDLPRAFSLALRTLDLSHNAFSGGIPLRSSHSGSSAPWCSPITRSPAGSPGPCGRRSCTSPLPVTLVYLSLAGNSLSGRVGPVPRRVNRLAFLDLGRNWFSGEVSGEVFAFRIGYLQLRKNAFSGVLRPAGLVSPGTTMNLSHNALSGRVPAVLATAGAVYLNGNRFAVEVPREVAAAVEAGRMWVLFLQDNFLTGIPVGGMPASAAVCTHWNCIAPPLAVVAACPAKGGRGRRRPQAQCGGRRG